MVVPADLKAVSDDLAVGKAVSTSPRTLLTWFGAHRRGFRVVKRIHKALDSLELTTVPDFEYAWIDEDIKFQKTKSATGTASGTAHASGVGTTETGQSPSPGTTASPSSTVLSDPTYRIGKLDAANQPLKSVAPDDSLHKAVTLMMINNYSQLPIMQGERSLKGLISWESIAQATLLGNSKPAKVSDCATVAYEISSETSLFDAIAGIVKNGYALIRSRDNRISGIVTSTDLGVQLGRLGEPFLLLGELENYLRRVIGPRFSIDQLRAARDPADTRIVDSVEDLSLGEYIRLLENPTNWDLLKLSLERSEFVTGLQAIRELRNDVMHFDPDGPDESELSPLRSWVALFQRLATLKVI
jgi:hypothetical protein